MLLHLATTKAYKGIFPVLALAFAEDLISLAHDSFPPSCGKSVILPLKYPTITHIGPDINSLCEWPVGVCKSLILEVSNLTIAHTLRLATPYTGCCTLWQISAIYDDSIYSPNHSPSALALVEPDWIID